jgi:ferritin-like metal-binding protein YciE
MQERSTRQEEEVALFFSSTLKKMYWAEKNILLLLDQMRTAAFTNDLKNVIEIHLTQTEQHIQRLEHVFQETAQAIEDKVCEALKGLLEDAAATIRDTKRKTRSRDIGIIASLLKVEHYEMATYSILIPLSHSLGWPKATTLLEQTLKEEKQAEAELIRRPY